MNEEDIFQVAAEMPAGERAAYLATACEGQPALRQRVERLLASHDDGGFMQRSSDRHDSAELEAELARLKPEEGEDRIGHYKLLQKIGEGGFGTVWMAEQLEPVRRRVALKIIKPGMDSKEVLVRFEQERQALALMDHPNIAKVLDAGVTPLGRPFFVMELVRGIRITDFCDENNLPTGARLDLFIAVCNAIQHAHQKGVIHRDIKPSNILVTLHDGVPVPKVIDFGVAKAIQSQRLTDLTFFTRFEQMIGTPLYMSPEQAEMSGLDIDTRSDIYSLGVLLYELLTGTTPFDAEKLMALGIDAMRQTIRETEPVRPSTRLTQELAGAARMRNAQRGTRDAESSDAEPPTRDSALRTPNSALTPASSHRLLQIRELIHQLKGDLDWIVMKCLEKDRARRYETANSIAADIQRHLGNEPVTARPPSGCYRLRKFVRRNKGAFAAALALAVVLLMGVLASTSQAIRARRAEREQTKLRQQAETSNRDLRDMVSLLELKRAEDLFRMNDPSAGVAHLAAMLRRDPSNHIAANRLVSALVHRNWALPAAPPMRHLERVPIVSFSPDGRHVLSASWDKTAQIWEATTGKSLATVPHEAQIFSARYNRAGTCFVTASADGTARIWSATNGTALTPPLRHDGKVYWAEFSSDGQSVVTASADKSARIWDTASGALKLKLSRATYVVRACFSPDGAQVATGGDLGSVRMWNATSGEMLFQVENRVKALTALAFSPDGRWLVSACDDGIARLWNATNGQPNGYPLAHKHKVFHAVFSPDSRLLLTTSEDGAARLWNATNGLPTGEQLLHEGSVVFGEFSPDGRMVITTSMDNSARLWDVATGKALSQPLRQHEAILQAGFSPDGGRLVTASFDGTVQIWNIAQRPSETFEMLHTRRVTSVAFNSRGDAVLTTSFDKTARLWNARSGEPLLKPMRHEAAVQCGSFSPDGQRVVTASTNGSASVWDANTGREVAGPVRHAKGIWFVRFGPDGNSFATASADATARVWNSRTGQPITPPLTHDDEVLTACFSPDGRFVVTASKDNSARVWNARTGEPVTEPLRHLDHVKWAEFSPDGEKVVTASTDNHAGIWDVRTSRRVTPLLQHARIVEKAAFSPDGRRVVTGSMDFTARVWDAKTGQALTPPLRHDTPVSQVAFSPDGGRLLTACWGGAARVWDASTGQPLTEWLNSDALLADACFDATGRRIATASHRGARVWDTPTALTPVPNWLPALAEAVAGIRLSARGNVELVTREGLDACVGQLKQKAGNDFYENLARWFLADPSDRPVSPF